jgi:hypothetical protein
MRPALAAADEPAPTTSRSGASPDSSALPRYPWWDELQELFANRKDILHGAEVPGSPGMTAEESARNAAFWILFYGQGLFEKFVAELRRGENVRLEVGVYAYAADRVDFNIRIVERDADPTPEGLA